MLIWAENEAVFLKYPYYKVGRRLRRKVCVFATCFLSLALFEHVLSRSSNFYNYEYEIRNCNWTVSSRMELYSMRDFNHMFRFVPYHWTLGAFFFVCTYTMSFVRNIWLLFCTACIPLQLFHGLLTFAWNFPDLFIINISFGLAERFRQMTEHLMEVYKNNIEEVNSFHIRMCSFKQTEI